jgi:hypothetical protein
MRIKLRALAEELSPACREDCGETHWREAFRVPRAALQPGKSRG